MALATLARMSTSTIAFVGGGNMAGALIGGLLKTGRPAASILVVEPFEAQRAKLAQNFGVQAKAAADAGLASAGLVVWAVKPQLFAEAAAPCRAHVGGALQLSVMAGIPSDAIARASGSARVVRAMPNTPALVDAAATALARGEHALESDLDDARRIFDAIGITVVLDESQLDAVTGLSGSGPAYVFLILEALADGGVKVGLSRRTAQLLAAQTLFGSAKLLLETNEHPGRLKDMVTSPGGTAITGLHTLENGGVRTTLMNAVEAATRRSRELGEALLPK
jgi:pyrroline-5-carboxylate reductase